MIGPWQNRPGPLYRRLSLALTDAILDGRLVPGDRLPSHRLLADGLGLSRSTAVRACEELQESGLLSAHARSGNYVQLPEGSRTKPGPWLPAAGPLSRPIDLSKATTRADDDVVAVLGRAAGDVAALKDRDGYDVLGIAELREAVARRFTRRGLPTSAEQVLITSGAQHGIDLVTRLLVHAGEPVLVESPAYAGLLDRLRQARADLTGLDISETAWDVERFADTARRTRARIAFLTPDFHNPTGRLMAQPLREEFAEAAARERITLVVDETNAELALDDDFAMPAPLAAVSSAQGAITVGSLSKCVWAGLRIGWVRAEPTTIQLLANLKVTSTLSTPLLEQLAATRLLEDDALDRFLRGRRPHLARRRELVLRTALDLGFTPTRPVGGLSSWAMLPAGSSSEFARTALQRQLLLLPGTRLSPHGVLDRFIRLPYSLPDEELRTACATLELAWRSYAGSRHGPAGYPDPVV
ncbi:PLP-dependent aminotransferase family protein [Amycolatopsis sp. NPDC051102]|uniref:aminotransferase-like domain-containing protein n=1 Tax=Amycolatopsis sp. NPDC051102 TaxID=3155163 RepID=UPI003419B53A